MKQLFLVWLLCLGFAVGTYAANPDASYLNVPLGFEQNSGQTDSAVDFLARGDGYTVFLTQGDAVIALRSGSGNQVLRLNLVGADLSAPAVGLSDLGSRSNYLTGEHPSPALTGLAHYGRIEYRHVYDGIDVHYYGNQRQLEYDFVVNAGADPGLIRLNIDGAKRLHVADNGDLVVALDGAGRDVRFQAPVAYQNGPGGREPVAGADTVNPLTGVYARGTEGTGRHAGVIGSLFATSDATVERAPGGPLAAAAAAVTSAAAEIAPNDVPTGSSGCAFVYDILVTILPADSGVNRVTITVPAGFGVPSVTDVRVNYIPVAYTDNTAGNLISIDLTTKVSSTGTITVMFAADAPGAPDSVGQDFTSTVDDWTTPDPPQATTQGNGDGDASDANSWRVTTTDRAGTVLLVVLNKTTPTAQDAAKQTLIESWGYTVNLIEATESQANFDAAAAAANVAYISEEITSTDLGTKLTNADIGVINDEDALSDELGISSTFGLYTSSTIDITDKGHYVTSPFPVGSLAMASSAQPLHTVAGTLAPGIRVLAEQPATANGTLAIVEAGDVLTTPPGGTAAGYRVYLPWGGGAFDINALNANGRLLLLRSLEWGAGPCNCSRISGNVFEDVNYGGGAGRSKAASGGIGQQYADVELYDSAGVYIAGTNTDASGNYLFGGLAAGTYYVRVVTDSVRSSRAGWSTTCRPVLTYRTDATTGTAAAVTDFVGGKTPSASDPGKGSAGATFNTTSFVFTAVLTGTAQAVTKCVVTAGDITGVDFGFNYNTVVNVNNSGQGTLRQAITNMNTLTGDGSLAQAGLVAGRDNAVLMISNGTAAPGLRAANNYFSGGVATVAPDSALPVISTPMILNAQVQPGFGTTPAIQLDGTAAGAGVDGFSLSGTSDGSVIRGFIIKRCSRDGVLIQAGADSITIAGCWIGTDGTNTPTMRNTDDGIEIFGAYATIGGVGAYDRNVVNHNGDEGINITGAAATGNVIIGNFIGLEPNGSSGSGNTDVGIAILPGATANRIGGLTVAERNVISLNVEGIEINTADNQVLGNFIGTDSTGTENRGNHSDDGVELQSVNALRNRIGDTLTGAGNLIAFNVLNGVTVAGGNRNSVLGNRIHSNSLRGIDLANNGVTPNDSADGDGGANRLQNYPVLDSAITNGVDTVFVYGMLNSFINADFLVELFADSVADPTSYGEGATYLGKTWVTTNGLGKTTFSAALPALVPVGRVISTTATDTLGNTSEFCDTARVRWPATSLSVAVSNSTFAFGVQAPNTWLTAQSSVITNDGTLTENLAGQISQLTDGANTWAISATTNGADSVHAQWSTVSAAGPWTNISAYDSNFMIASNVVASDSVTFWLRIRTPTATTSHQPYSSTLTVTAQ